MDRRDFVVAAGGTILTAGCLTGSSGDDSNGGTDTPTSTSSPPPTSEPASTVDTQTETVPSASGPADLQVAAVRAEPNGVELGGSVTFVVEVANHGGQAGTGTIGYTITPMESPDTVADRGTLDVSVPGGVKKTYTVAFTSSRTRSYTFTVATKQTTVAHENEVLAQAGFLPKRLQFGESFLNYAGYELAVVDHEFRESYEIHADDGGTETVEPESEDLFAFVRVRVASTADASGDAPMPGQFRVHSIINGNFFEVSVEPGTKRANFAGEVSDTTLYTGDDFQAGTTRTGYLVFEVSEAAREAFVVRWDSPDRGDQTVKWREKWDN